MLIDLFAGAGGVDLGARMIGMEALGIEIDEDACATRLAAGFWTLRGDVATLDPCRVAPGARALWASPPCPSFSAAGKRMGLTFDAEIIEGALQRIESGIYATEDLEERALGATTWSDVIARCGDSRSGLVLEPLRWILALDDTLELIAFEQVPPVLPIWERIARWLREFERPYHVWTGILNAADYGVPQTRERAFLMASRRGPVAPPTATHSRDGGFWTCPWVSMAEALGWDGAVRTRGDMDPRKGGNVFQADAPSWAVTGRARSWLRSPQSVAGGERAVRAPEEPSVTVTSGFRSAQWWRDRPATTVVGSWSPNIIAAPGYRGKGKPSRQDAPESVRITIEEASVLQGFPPDFPWQGSRTAQFRQIGNAVPPPIAAHVLAALCGIDLSARGTAA